MSGVCFRRISFSLSLSLSLSFLHPPFFTLEEVVLLPFVLVLENYIDHIIIRETSVPNEKKN
jgi:hypothetical protein